MIQIVMSYVSGKSTPPSLSRGNQQAFVVVCEPSALCVGACHASRHACDMGWMNRATYGRIEVERAADEGGQSFNSSGWVTNLLAIVSRSRRSNVVVCRKDQRKYLLSSSPDLTPKIQGSVTCCSLCHLQVFKPLL